MSRDQFSQQMLVYTGMAADIVEIFEAFRESKVGKGNKLIEKENVRKIRKFKTVELIGS